MSATTTSQLRTWIRENYFVVGVREDGCFIGKQRFKERLIALPGVAEKTELIRKLVDDMVAAGDFKFDNKVRELRRWAIPRLQQFGALDADSSDQKKQVKDHLIEQLHREERHGYWEVATIRQIVNDLYQYSAAYNGAFSLVNTLQVLPSSSTTIPEIEAWISQEHRRMGFVNDKFVGRVVFKQRLTSQINDYQVQEKVKMLVNKMDINTLNSVPPELTASTPQNTTELPDITEDWINTQIPRLAFENGSSVGWPDFKWRLFREQEQLEIPPKEISDRKSLIGNFIARMAATRNIIGASQNVNQAEYSRSTMSGTSSSSSSQISEESVAWSHHSVPTMGTTDDSLPSGVSLTSPPEFTQYHPPPDTLGTSGVSNLARANTLSPAEVPPPSAHSENDGTFGIPAKSTRPPGYTRTPLLVKSRTSVHSPMHELQAFAQELSNVGGSSNTKGVSIKPSLEQQLCLLDHDNIETEHGLSTNEVQSAVLFSSDILEGQLLSLLPQYGLLGNCSPVNEPSRKHDRRIFLNTNIPFSFFICGVQGSGKSHSMSCLLENCVIPSPTLGVLKNPLSALVLHFGQYTSPANFQPCEAAFLGYPNPQFSNQGMSVPVTVLIPPSNPRLASSYNKIPGVKVIELKLRPKELNISSLLTLMSVEQSQSVPLYLAQVTLILREMATDSTGDFDYLEFKRRVDAMRLSNDQRTFLQQRLLLLESFLELDPEKEASNAFDFRAGGVTVVDLSCPFVDESTACVLFNICVGIYLENKGTQTGKVVAMDEAHKYMTDTPGSKRLTDSLLSVIRQQRHLGARVVISTQEPTISPRLMDLCSVTMIHKFTSPEWFDVLRKHVSINSSEEEKTELFKNIINLHTGEALVFAPSALISHAENEQPTRLNSEFMRVKVRKRVTWDGGRSIVACN